MWNEILRALVAQGGCKFIRCSPEQKDALCGDAIEIAAAHVPPMNYVLDQTKPDGVGVSYRPHAAGAIASIRRARSRITARGAA